MSVYNGKHLVCIYRWSKISLFSEPGFKDSIYNAVLAYSIMYHVSIWISINLLLVPSKGNKQCILLNWKYVCSCALVTYITNWYILFSASITHLVQSNQTLIKEMLYLWIKRDCCNHKGRARKKTLLFWLIVKIQGLTIQWLPSLHDHQEESTVS